MTHPQKLPQHAQHARGNDRDCHPDPGGMTSLKRRSVSPVFALLEKCSTLVVLKRTGEMAAAQLSGNSAACSVQKALLGLL